MHDSFKIPGFEGLSCVVIKMYLSIFLAQGLYV